MFSSSSLKPRAKAIRDIADGLRCRLNTKTTALKTGNNYVSICISPYFPPHDPGGEGLWRYEIRGLGYDAYQDGYASESEALESALDYIAKIECNRLDVSRRQKNYYLTGTAITDTLAAMDEVDCV